MYHGEIGRSYGWYSFLALGVLIGIPIFSKINHIYIRIFYTAGFAAFLSLIGDYVSQMKIIGYEMYNRQNPNLADIVKEEEQKRNAQQPIKNRSRPKLPANNNDGNNADNETSIIINTENNNQNTENNVNTLTTLNNAPLDKKSRKEKKKKLISSSLDKLPLVSKLNPTKAPRSNNPIATKGNILSKTIDNQTFESNTSLIRDYSPNVSQDNNSSMSVDPNHSPSPSPVRRRPSQSPNVSPLDTNNIATISSKNLSAVSPDNGPGRRRSNKDLNNPLDSGYKLPDLNSPINPVVSGPGRKRSTSNNNINKVDNPSSTSNQTSNVQSNNQVTPVSPVVSGPGRKRSTSNNKLTPFKEDNHHPSPVASPRRRRSTSNSNLNTITSNIDTNINNQVTPVVSGPGRKRSTSNNNLNNISQNNSQNKYESEKSTSKTYLNVIINDINSKLYESEKPNNVDINTNLNNPTVPIVSGPGRRRVSNNNLKPISANNESNLNTKQYESEKSASKNIDNANNFNPKQYESEKITTTNTNISPNTNIKPVTPIVSGPGRKRISNNNLNPVTSNVNNNIAINPKQYESEKSTSKTNLNEINTNNSNNVNNANITNNIIIDPKQYESEKIVIDPRLYESNPVVSGPGRRRVSSNNITVSTNVNKVNQNSNITPILNPTPNPFANQNRFSSEDDEMPDLDFESPKKTVKPESPGRRRRSNNNLSTPIQNPFPNQQFMSEKHEEIPDINLDSPIKQPIRDTQNIQDIQVINPISTPVSGPRKRNLSPISPTKQSDQSKSPNVSYKKMESINSEALLKPALKKTNTTTSKSENLKVKFDHKK